MNCARISARFVRDTRVFRRFKAVEKTTGEKRRPSVKKKKIKPRSVRNSQPGNTILRAQNAVRNIAFFIFLLFFLSLLFVPSLIVWHISFVLLWWNDPFFFFFFYHVSRTDSSFLNANAFKHVLLSCQIFRRRREIRNKMKSLVNEKIMEKFAWLGVTAASVIPSRQWRRSEQLLRNSWLDKAKEQPLQSVIIGSQNRCSAGWLVSDVCNRRESCNGENLR